MARSAWKKIARKYFGKKAVHHFGDGQFAPCRELHYSLRPTWEEAQPTKAFVDRTGCGGECNPRSHYMVDLAQVE